MKTDSDIERDVEVELRWSPEVGGRDIAVKVTGGEVRLSGFARSYLERCTAEAATKRIRGVAAVANDIEVRPLPGIATDPEIARAAITALKRELPHDWKKIGATVSQGRICLEGAVQWHYQRECAESAIRHLKGVVSVNNSIRIEPSAASTDIRHAIENAFRRSAQLDAIRIRVEAEGSDVTLRGEVRSWADHHQAQRTAWEAPGVSNVKNELTVRT